MLLMFILQELFQATAEKQYGLCSRLASVIIPMVAHLDTIILKSDLH